MSNQNMTQRCTQACCLDVMINRCSPDSQHERNDRHPANVGCSFFRYTNEDVRNYTNQRRKHKTWIREDNQLALHFYFKSKLKQIGYRKIMIEICQKYASFPNTSQRRTNQGWTIIKKIWFSDFEILEIKQKINIEQDSNTISDTPSIDEQEQCNRNEPLNSENRNTTQSKKEGKFYHKKQEKNRKFIENYERGKDYHATSKKHRRETRQDRNLKNKQSTKLYINK